MEWIKVNNRKRNKDIGQNGQHEKGGPTGAVLVTFFKRGGRACC